MQQKYEAILAGMGIGHLPAFWAREAVAQGSLCVVDTLEKPPTVESLIAWQRGRSGRALRWFVDAAKRVLTDSSGVFAV
jgi:DNA-binding transcriptional LysR family regulator